MEILAGPQSQAVDAKECGVGCLSGSGKFGEVQSEGRLGNERRGEVGLACSIGWIGEVGRRCGSEKEDEVSCSCGSDNVGKS